MEKKCINCQNACNNKKGRFICYHPKSNFCLIEVINREFDCQYFDEIIDLDENYEIKNDKYKK